jgi:hypothetical protein
MNATAYMAGDETPDVIERDSVGRDVLEARANLLELSVRKTGHIPPAEIDAERPGTVLNPDTSAMGWLHYLCQLHRMHERGPASTTTTGSLRWDSLNMTDVRAALHAEPITVTMEDGTQRAVYPKGEYALARVVMIEFTLRYALERRLALELVASENTSPELLDALASAVDLQSVLEREFVWILTHPGSDVPWEEEARWTVEPPLWTRAITPIDMMMIRAAHLDVNLLRINAVSERSRRLAGKGTGEGMPLAAFMGLMASELGVQPKELARRWSLGEVFVQSLMRWEAMERARMQSEQEAAAQA